MAEQLFSLHLDQQTGKSHRSTYPIGDLATRSVSHKFVFVFDGGCFM